jgi:hypothetical protein
MSSTPSSGIAPEASTADGEISPEQVEATTEQVEATTEQVEATTEQVEATIQSRSFLVLLVIAGVVGAVVSLVAWGFLELIHQIQQGVFVRLPSDLGYHHGPPLWWSLPVLAIAGLIVAFAIVHLPGNGVTFRPRGLPAAAARRCRSTCQG